MKCFKSPPSCRQNICQFLLIVNAALMRLAAARNITPECQLTQSGAKVIESAIKDDCIFGIFWVGRNPGFKCCLSVSLIRFASGNFNRFHHNPFWHFSKAIHFLLTGIFLEVMQLAWNDVLMYSMLCVLTINCTIRIVYRPTKATMLLFGQQVQLTEEQIPFWIIGSWFNSCLFSRKDHHRYLTPIKIKASRRKTSWEQHPMDRILCIIVCHRITIRYKYLDQNSATVIVFSKYIYPF